MPEPDVFQVVDRYLRGEIPEIDLRQWLNSYTEWLVQAAPEDQRQLGLMAQQMGWVLQDGEITEQTYRRDLRSEYRKARKLRPSRVS